MFAFKYLMPGWAKITYAIGSWTDITLLPNGTKKIRCAAKGTGKKFKHLWIEEVTVNSVNDYVQPDALISYDDGEVWSDDWQISQMNIKIWEMKRTCHWSIEATGCNKRRKRCFKTFKIIFKSILVKYTENKINIVQKNS
jgi:hypothetical protein